MTTGPAISQSTLAASAATTEPAQKTATPRQHDLLAAEEVAEGARGQHEGGEREGVAVHHPLEGGDPGVEIALDVGQPDADDRVVQEGQEEDDAERGQGDGLGGRAKPALLHRKAGCRPVDHLGAARLPPPLGQHGPPPRRGLTEAGSMVWLTHWSFAYPEGG